MPAVIGPVRPKVAGAFKVVAAGRPGRAVRQVRHRRGLITYQDSSGVEQTAQLANAAGGATVTSGTADPTGGSDGDAYIQVDGSIGHSKPVAQQCRDVGRVHRPVRRHRGRPGPVGRHPETVRGTGASAGTSEDASRSDHQHNLADGAVTQPKLSDGSVHTSKIADLAVTAAKIPNQEISHVKLSSSVGGANQAAGRIQEATGSGGMRWADKGGGSGTSGDKLISIDFPTPDATNVYDIIDHLGVAYQNRPEVVGASVTWSASVDGDDVSDLWGEVTGTYIFRGIAEYSRCHQPAVRRCCSAADWRVPAPGRYAVGASGQPAGVGRRAVRGRGRGEQPRHGHQRRLRLRQCAPARHGFHGRHDSLSVGEHRRYPPVLGLGEPGIGNADR